MPIPSRFPRFNRSPICLLGNMICALVLATNTTGAVASNMAEDNKEVTVILGASYARGWPIESINGTIVVNKGLDGNQSFEMRSRFQEDVVAVGPDTVIIWGFINDIFRSDADKMEDAKDRIKQSYKEMLAMAQDHNINVILATEISVREPKGALNRVAGLVGRMMGKTSYQTMINQHVSEINDWLRVYAESNQLVLFDFQAALADSDGQRRAEYATDDGSHVTTEAYVALSKFAENVLGPTKGLAEDQ